MRLRFLDTDRLKRKARENVETGIAGLKRWWSKKYKLPPNHDLFLNQNIGELNLEMFEDWYLRKTELETMLTDKSYLCTIDQVREMQKELDELLKVLGEVDITGDDLIDKWERELESGVVPNLNEGLNRD